MYVVDGGITEVKEEEDVDHEMVKLKELITDMVIPTKEKDAKEIAADNQNNIDSFMNEMGDIKILKD